MAHTGFDDSKFKPYDERPQQYNGVAVVQRSPALLPHPNPSQGGRLVASRGVTHVLLENSYEFFECDYRDCGWTAENPRSVLAHLTSHNPSKREPDYDENTLKKLVQIAHEERAVGFRGYCERTAERLNALGLTRTDGGPFAPENVSYLYSRHRDRYPARRRRGSTKVAVTPKEKTKTKTKTNDLQPHTLAERIQAGLDQVRAELDQVERQLHMLQAALDRNPPADAELARKAARYDELVQRLTGD